MKTEKKMEENIWISLQSNSESKQTNSIINKLLVLFCNQPVAGFSILELTAISIMLIPFPSFSYRDKECTVPGFYRHHHLKILRLRQNQILSACGDESAL